MQVCSRITTTAAGMLAAVFFASGVVHANPVALGKTKHEQACALCHGKDGIATMANTPHLAGQPEFYMVEQLRALRSGKRPSEVMNVIAKPLSDDEIKNLAAWYASIEIKATVK
jgi:cytochrome c553